MSVEVVMPQMGESITEGTISKWLKKVGDKIERDEPLLEISTDKVDAEVPSPLAGVLLEIRHQEGETVEVGTAVGILGAEGETAAVQNSNSNGQGQAAPLEKAEPESISEPVAQSQTATAASNNQQSANDGDEQSQATTAATNGDMQNQTAGGDTSAHSESANANSSTVEIVMPQMGESITEGTISKWLKKVGDAVERDEPLLEISTDKVDAEVPSAAAGMLLEIRHNEGDTVEVGTVLALVGSESAAAGAAQTSGSETPGQKQAETIAAQATGADAVVSTPVMMTETQAVSAPNFAPKMPLEEKMAIQETEGRSYDYGRPNAVVDAVIGTGANSNGGAKSVEELRRTKSSPLVRNIAREHGVDISKIPGSGMSGRVTKKDILSFIDTGAGVKPEDLLVKTATATTNLTPAAMPANVPQTAPPQVQTPVAQTQQQRADFTAPQVSSSVSDRIEPMSVMRKKIAEHMTFSKQTSAHVTSVYEIDMTNVARFRDKNKNEFQARYGTKLTFMPFIFQTVTQALRKFPVVNSQVAGDQIVYKGDVNLGMAVALDWGLIVPVIRRADSLSLSGLALSANDLAERARAKKLNPDEVQGGTFTITNPGVFGGLFGTPIINQPQVAILCVGTIEKRPKVITTAEGDDVIAIRSMAYFALTYDHRIVDGADAERFLSFMKQYLETTQFGF